MSFASPAEFLAMGGHGLYVWLSYGAAVAVVLFNVLSVRLRRRRFFRQALARERRTQRQPAATVALTGDSKAS